MRSWFNGGLVGLVGLIALFVAASAEQGFWHYAGFVLAGLSVLLVFRLVARAFDPPQARSPLIPVPREESTRYFIGGLAALLGIVGLMVASGAHGTGAGYYLGLLLAGLAWLYVFRLIAAAVR